MDAVKRDDLARRLMREEWAREQFRAALTDACGILAANTRTLVLRDGQFVGEDRDGVQYPLGRVK